MYDVIYALSLKCSPTKNFLGEQIPFFLLFFNAFALFENFLFFKNLPFFPPALLKMSERNKYIYSSIQLIEALMPMPRRQPENQDLLIHTNGPIHKKGGKKKTCKRISSEKNLSIIITFASSKVKAMYHVLRSFFVFLHKKFPYYFKQKLYGIANGFSFITSA